LTEKCLEKYLKKLVGRTDMKDALKKLDSLTTEEARMATAQTLKATHAVDGRVRRVEDKVLDVDNRVVGVDDRVAGVDNRLAGVDYKVAGVDDRVASVDDKVKAVDDKVAVVINGARLFSTNHEKSYFNPDVYRRKRGEGSHG
jgi:archaellum component FlaC